MLKTVLAVMHVFFGSLMNRKFNIKVEQHLFEMENFCNIINVFAVTFECVLAE